MEDMVFKIIADLILQYKRQMDLLPLNEDTFVHEAVKQRLQK